MKKVFNTKPFWNKHNNQLSIYLPKNKFKVFKDKIPKELKLEIKEIKW